MHAVFRVNLGYNEPVAGHEVGGGAQDHRGVEVLLRRIWILCDNKTPGMFVIVLALHHCDKILDINGLKKERFILVHGFRGFSPWSAGSIAVRLS